MRRILLGAQDLGERHLLVVVMGRAETHAEEKGPSVEEQTLATLQETRDELTPPFSALPGSIDSFFATAAN